MGHPGTGKSTAARLLGYFFKEFEILKNNKFTEVSRADLVGDVIGATERRVKDVLTQSLDGVLFINEAHQLVSEDKRDYGKIAIQEIMKFMEDHRERIVIVVDGIPEFLNDFLKTHPGLRDRFSRKIDFPDISNENLCKITEIILDEFQYELEPKAFSCYENLISRLRNKYKKHETEFANIRTIRNLIELIFDEHSKRLYSQNEISISDFKTIREIDIETVEKNYFKGV